MCIQIHTSEFVLEIIQNTQIHINEIVTKNARIVTYLFVENQQIIPICLYEIEVKKYQLVYIISYKGDCTNIPTYSQKRPKGGS